jgi:glucose/arabinose dehydrogenase
MKKLASLFALLLLGSAAFAQYTTTNIVTGLRHPIAMEFAPDGRIFLTQKGGDGFSTNQAAQVRIFNSAGTALGILWDFTDSVETYFERGVLGVALDPDFDNNHYVYVFYNHASPAMIRVVRITENNNVGINPVVIFQYSDPFSAGNHTGGNIHFKPGDNDHLFISIGDRAVQANSQLLTNPCGKLLRINKDGSIPTDNPFYDDGIVATGNDDRIWCYGLRNTFDFTFSTVNDSIYGSENGLNTWDEVNQLMRSANYGWPTCEGFFNQGSTTVNCSMAGSVLPIDTWGAPLPAITGIIIYDHPLMPEFQGHMLVADYDNGRITDIELTGAAQNVAGTRVNFPTVYNRLVEIVQGPEGCIYIIQGGYTTNGSIRRICPSDMSTNDDRPELAFDAYPNPASETIQLDIPGLEGLASVELIDITGKVVLSESVNQSRQLLNVEHLGRGIYFVRVVSNGRVGILRLVLA